MSAEMRAVEQILAEVQARALDCAERYHGEAYTYELGRIDAVTSIVATLRQRGLIPVENVTVIITGTAEPMSGNSLAARRDGLHGRG